MKRTLAKVLSIVTVVSMAAVPTYASAATETADSNTSVYLREISTSNGDRAVIGTQGQKRLHNRSCLKRILLHLVKTYSPDQLEAFEEAFEIHRELHEELKEIRLELKEKYTPDELKDIAKEVRKEMKEWIKENGNKKSEVKALLRDLKKAVEENDTEKVVELLGDVYDVIMIHIDVDRHRIEVLREY